MEKLKSLEKAVESGDLKPLEIILDQSKPNPFVVPKVCDNIEMVRLIIESKRVDINYENILGETPIYHAFYFKNMNTFKAFLNDSRTNLNGKNSFGNSLFSICCAENATEYATLIVKSKRFDVNKVNALHDACEFAHAEIVKLILDTKKPNLKAVNDEGRNALHMACLGGNAQIVEMLLNDPEIDVNLKDSNNEAPIHYAVIFSYNKILQLLLFDSRIDLYSKNRNGETPFMCAIKKSNFEAIHLFNVLDLIREEEFGDLSQDFLRDFPNFRQDAFKFEAAKALEIPLEKLPRYYSAFIYLMIEKFSDLKSSQRTPENRFFRLTSRLPAELKMKVANQVSGLNKDFISKELLLLLE